MMLTESQEDKIKRFFWANILELNRLDALVKEKNKDGVGRTEGTTVEGHHSSDMEGR